MKTNENQQQIKMRNKLKSDSVSTIIIINDAENSLDGNDISSLCTRVQKTIPLKDVAKLIHNPFIYLFKILFLFHTTDELIRKLSGAH